MGEIGTEEPRGAAQKLESSPARLPFCLRKRVGIPVVVLGDEAGHILAHARPPDEREVQEWFHLSVAADELDRAHGVGYAQAA